jgi:hypothetical protein
MLDYNVSKEDLINIRDRFIPPKIYKPKVDITVSKIVGKTVFQTDPKLLKLVCGWKRNKPIDSLEPDNFFQDQDKVKELIETFK